MLVSVVMPAYNCASTLDCAVGAILGQDYHDFELLICDDGSDDDTLEAARCLAASDGRVRLLSGNHEGVSFARNRGLSHARGDYIAFADADDEPLPCWLGTLVAGIEDADLSVVGYRVESPEGAFLHSTEQRKAEGLVPAPDFMRALFSNEFMYQGYVWNKLFRKGIIDGGEHPLRFAEDISYNEDRLFVFDYLRRCIRVSVDDRICYRYFQHPSDGVYTPAKGTEADALERMIAQLESDAEGAESLFFARKDLFRASVLLYEEARQAAYVDAARFAAIVDGLRDYLGEFDDYPLEFRHLAAHIVDVVAKS